jgi:hypothetical protein
MLFGGSRKNPRLRISAHDIHTDVVSFVARAPSDRTNLTNRDRDLFAEPVYMIRAVLSGRGDEVIDLAKTNLMR